MEKEMSLSFKNNVFKQQTNEKAKANPKEEASSSSSSSDSEVSEAKQ
jgi:hypothetical protein